MPSTINFLRLIADPTRLRLLLLLEQDLALLQLGGEEQAGGAFPLSRRQAARFDDPGQTE